MLLTSIYIRAFFVVIVTFLLLFGIINFRSMDCDGSINDDFLEEVDTKVNWRLFLMVIRNRLRTNGLRSA